MPLLIGALAHPALRDLLVPAAVEVAPLNGYILSGGGTAGLDVMSWPGLCPQAQGRLPVWHSEWAPALRRYCDIFGLAECDVGDRAFLGIQTTPLDEQGEWQPDLACAMAQWLLDLPAELPTQDIRRRLPMIATWVSAQERAGLDTRDLSRIGPEGDERLEVQSRNEPYARFFSVEEMTLRHRRHRGDWSPAMLRAVFISGDAAVVLPWDPVRDNVLLIDQLRAGPVARGDHQPWLYETVAGRVDAGETPEEAALREAREEAGLHIRHLIPGPHNYPTPGMVAEFLYLYIGIADLPEAAAGFGGLADEDEDIRSHIVPRAELTRMAMQGEIRNGPLLSLTLWLELQHERLVREQTGQG